MNIKKMIIGTALSLAIFPLITTAVLAASSVVYNNIPEPLPGNVPSLGYEATSTSEFGSQIELTGAERYNPVVTVLMSSWACESGAWHTADCFSNVDAKFTHPITINVYDVGPDNSVGSLILTKTESFSMPYRPSADLFHCQDGRWYDGTTCFNGKAFTISFNLNGQTLPNKIIVGVAYNTAHYGETPLGEVGPYDSLNVGLNSTPNVGNNLPTNKDAYLDSTWGDAYCDGGSVTGTFRLDSGCWTGYLPAIKVSAEATPVDPPLNIDQCKNGKWKIFNNPPYKNQGQCVSYVVNAKNN